MRKGKIECKKSSRRQTLIIGVYLLLSRLPTSHTTVRAVRHTAVPILDSILYKRQIGRYNLACVAYHWIWLAVPCGQPRSNALYEVSVRWVRCLPPASFRFHLAMDTLALGYSLPAIRAASGLAPVRQCSCRAYQEMPIAFSKKNYRHIRISLSLN